MWRATDDATVTDAAAKKYFGENGAPRDHRALAEYYRSRKGNTHFSMSDLNNIQIADQMSKFVSERSWTNSLPNHCGSFT
jgi:hypothetical protein